ncbi:hypothetical protein ACI2JA_03510 [Alkalihalobacillus sp. NPDC078783]
MGKQLDISEVVDDLYMYDEDKDGGASYIIDTALEIIEDAFEFMDEGRTYQTFYIKVENGANVPKLHSDYQTSSNLTGDVVKLKVMAIVSVEFAKDGGLLVGILGKKLR